MSAPCWLTGQSWPWEGSPSCSLWRESLYPQNVTLQPPNDEVHCCVTKCMASHLGFNPDSTCSWVTLSQSVNLLEPVFFIALTGFVIVLHSGGCELETG